MRLAPKMIVAFLLAVAVRADDVDPLVPYLTLTVHGGLAVGATPVFHAPTSEGAPDGALLRLDDLPAGATVQHAVLYWSALSATSPVPAGSPTFDGQPIVPVRVGELPQTPCFPAQPNTAIFRADVTPFVTAAGAFQLEGFPFDGVTLTEGATLFVIHESPGAELTTVAVREGISVTDVRGEVTTQVIDGFLAAGPAPPAAVLAAAIGNGQIDEDGFFFEGVDLEEWAGPQLDGGIGRYYDLTRIDVTGLVQPGARRVTFELSCLDAVFSDCHTLGAAAVAVRSVACTADEPSALDLRPGAPPLLVMRAAPGMLRLAWEWQSTAHQVWSGTIGGWYDHGAVACDVVVAEASLPLPSEDTYYVVAGCGAGTSGGRDSFGAERPDPRLTGGTSCP